MSNPRSQTGYVDVFIEVDDGADPWPLWQLSNCGVEFLKDVWAETVTTVSWATPVEGSITIGVDPSWPPPRDDAATVHVAVEPWAPPSPIRTATFIVAGVAVLQFLLNSIGDAPVHVVGDAQPTFTRIIYGPAPVHVAGVVTLQLTRVVSPAGAIVVAPASDVVFTRILDLAATVRTVADAHVLWPPSYYGAVVAGIIKLRPQAVIGRRRIVDAEGSIIVAPDDVLSGRGSFDVNGTVHVVPEAIVEFIAGGGGLPPTPGGDCNSAGTVSMGVSFGATIDANGEHWWKIALTGGVEVHAKWLTVNGTLGGVILYTGPDCANLANEGNLDVVGDCHAFTPGANTTLYLQLLGSLTGSATYTLIVDTGACP